MGAGHTRFGVLPEGPRALLHAAVAGAYASVDRGFAPELVGEAFLGTLGMSGWQLGNGASLLTEEAGLVGVPAARVENACASAGSALRAGIRAIESGARDVVLVAGIEKMTDMPSGRRRYWLGVSGDTEWERLAGLTFAGVYALMADRYLADYHQDREVLARVAVKAHENAARNPNAHFTKPITLDKALKAPPVADPLRLLDCCPVSDGAAAVLLAGADLAARFTDTPVLVAGDGAASDRLALQERESLTSLAATVRAGREAFERSGTAPDRMQVVELHDCFTIAELLALEDLGFAPRGGAGPMTVEGRTALRGALPVNPDGGLKAKGHPIGATGASQAYELFHQLRGSAGPRQVPGAEWGLAHNVGGSGASATVTVFRRGP